MCASSERHCEVAQLLLDKGAVVDFQDWEGWSALMLASREGHCEVAILLLDKGARIHLGKWSALMVACDRGLLKMATLWGRG